MLRVVNNRLNPSFNLAFEEELLLSDIVSRSPVFCLWRNQRSVIVGISQVVENEVNLQYCNDNGIYVVRRHTGGGAVYHDLGNLNFSFFFPGKPDVNPYQHVYTILQPAFQKLGIKIDISSTNDLLFAGKKFSGMAERVIEDKVMVHGTILFDTDLEVLSHALSTGKSKFDKPRGVASRRAVVTNLKDCIKNTEDIIQFADALGRNISATCDCDVISLPNDFENRVIHRAETCYLPLNKMEIKLN